MLVVDERFPSQYVSDLADETASRRMVAMLAEMLADVAGPVWEWGDGYGGWVRRRLEEAFESRGLPPTPPVFATPKRKRRRLTEAEVLTVAARAGAACASCGSTDGLVLDHVVAMARGGPDGPENRQVLCTPCNSSKGAR